MCLMQHWDAYVKFVNEEKGLKQFPKSPQIMYIVKHIVEAAAFMWQREDQVAEEEAVDDDEELEMPDQYR